MNLRKLLSEFKNDEYISISDIKRRMGVGYISAGKYLVDLIDKKYVYKNEQGKYAFKRKIKNPSINLIFLDVDGVLNCSTTKDKINGYTGIEDEKVYLLKQLVDQTNAKIVLVSTWKFYWYKEERLKNQQDELAMYLNQKLEKQGLAIYDKTVDFDVHGRGEGILEYLWRLKHMGVDIHKFVILDDEIFDYLGAGLTKHLVRTSYENGGLKSKHIKRAIEKMAD